MIAKPNIRIPAHTKRLLGASTTTIAITRPWPSFRYHSIGATTSAGQNMPEPSQTHQSPENKSLSQYLREYKTLFPNDAVGASLIESYEHLHSFPQETIKIGILYHDESVKSTSKLLETILADPLASNNETWFKEIANRDKSRNCQYVHQETVDINVLGSTHASIPSVDRFSIPSPVLSSLARPRYMWPDTSITLNDLEIYEINDLDRFPKLNACHFFVYVTNDITSTIKLPSSIRDKILTTLLDNNDYTPSSREMTPLPLTQEPDGTVTTPGIVKVNTQKSYQGIVDFLKNDTEASINYLESMVESNIFQFLKVIGYNLQIDQLIRWNMTKFLNKVARDEITVQKLEELYSDLKTREINKFSSQMHAELQAVFEPNTVKFFNKRLRWSKLYFKNDNVEYDLKDYFQNNFMNESIESYNFLRGRIISELQNHQFAKYSPKDSDVSNPLISMKRDLIGTRISTEVQPVVNSSLFYGMLYYQLPISLISLSAYQFFEFSANASTALLGLGMVMGFNHVSKTWEKFTKKWLAQLFDDVRVCIDRDCVENGLVKELTESYNEEKTMIEEKKRILTGIRSITKT